MKLFAVGLSAVCVLYGLVIWGIAQFLFFRPSKNNGSWPYLYLSKGKSLLQTGNGEEEKEESRHAA